MASMSKKKKIVIISLSVIAAFFILLIGAGVYALNWYCADIQATETMYISDTVRDQAQAKDIQLIAHRGFSAQAPENTLPAYTKAGEAGFWGAECDIYRTTDGKWVLMHDNYLYRLMKDAKLEKVDSMTYDELMQFTYDNGANIQDYPDLKVTLLEDYLDECLKYSMTPVIEYKSKKNYEYLGEVVEIIKEKDALDKCVIISFQLDALQEFRKYDKDVPMFYLVQNITDEKIEEAKTLGNAGINFNASKKKNDEAAVKKIIDAGLPVACWTVDDKDTLQKMYDWGVRIFTTNAITPDKDVSLV